jgi:uncharacterized protein YukE
VAALTPGDVKRWDADAIHGVFQTATNRAATMQRLGDSLQQVHNDLSDWQGDAGDAFRADLGKTRRDIDADGQESKQVAAAVSRAEADVRSVKSELDGIERAAEGYGWAITSDWRIDPGNTMIGLDRLTLAAEQQLLQGELDTCKLHAHNADQELATAVRGSVGDIPLDAIGHQPGAAPPAPRTPKPPAAGQPKSWQDMLLPAGPASAEPGGGPPKGPPVPAGAGGGKPASLEDMMLGRGQPADSGGKPPPGSLPDLLSRLGQPGAPGAPAPRLKPADVESFKAMARQTMISDGVPPDQIEGRLNDVVARTQQWMDNGMPNYVPPEPPRPPPPGFGEGFADRWFSTEQGIHDLTGQNGLSALGDSWGGMAKGLAGKAEEFLLQGPVAPINDLTHEFKSFLDNPAYYAGWKSADAAFTLPAMMFGPEGAGIGEIADIDAYTGMSHPPNLPIGFDNPTSYHPWSESAAQDLFSAFGHGEPTASLNQHLSDMVTHYVGDNPDRVVLGRFDGDEGGYIGEARGTGGIYFDTGDPTWKMLAGGLDKLEEQAVVWPVNEQFLRTQMENQIGRIDYMLNHNEYDSLEDMAVDRAGTYSSFEVNYLNEVAATYGYERVGDSWLYVGGGPK